LRTSGPLRRRLVVTAVVASALVATACSGSGPGNSGGAGTGPYVIGVPLSLTGPFAALGIPDRNGIELAVKDINAKGGVNGRQLELKVLDDASDPTKTISNVNRLVADKVTAIVGIDASTLLLSVAPTIARRKLFTVVPIATDAKGVNGGRTLFGLAPTLDNQARAQLCYATQVVKAHRIALVQTTDAASQSFLTPMTALIGQDPSLSIVASENVAVGSVDTTAVMTKVRAARPDVIIDNGAGATGTSMIKAARTLGLAAPVVGSIEWGQPAVLKAAGPSIDGAVVAGFLAPLTPAANQQAFVQKYKQTYGQDPAAFDTWSYDAVTLVAAALAKVPGATQSDGDKLTDALESASVQGVSGLYKFGPFDASKPGSHAAVQLKDFQFLTVKGGSLATAPDQPTCS
jgi:branched-chain amino acid transport system substrate-binding protein